MIQPHGTPPAVSLHPALVGGQSASPVLERELQQMLGVLVRTTSLPDQHAHKNCSTQAGMQARNRRRQKNVALQGVVCAAMCPRLPCGNRAPMPLPCATGAPRRPPCRPRCSAAAVPSGRRSLRARPDEGLTQKVHARQLAVDKPLKPSSTPQHSVQDMEARSSLGSQGSAALRHDPPGLRPFAVVGFCLLLT